MDALLEWALAYPALARLLWVIVLVLATVLVWSLFFCCWGSQSSTSPLERYLSAMEKQSKTKQQSQRKKKPKDKSVSAALLNEGIVGVIKLATPLSQEKQKRKEKEKHRKKTEEEEEKKEGKDEKEEEEKEEKPSTTVRRRNKRHLKVTIAPGNVTPASAEQVMSGGRRRVIERSASEESASDLSSSPFHGDTLPWNLPKHQRVKRSKSASGDVLDPAERAVIRIADERDRVQKKTFTKWVNKHLMKAQRHITDLYEDLRDGHNLISLLEVLSGETLPREKGRMRFHKLQNVQIALDFLKHRQVKLVNIRNDDIADGNPKLTLGLIWTIILHFQISDIQVNGQSDDMTAKEKLLLWSQRMVEGYHGLRCDNFTTSWRDGKLFNAIIHKHRPNLIEMNKVYKQTNLENLEQAFSVAERDLGVTRLLDPEDVDVPHPDEKSIITYVSSLYDVMPRVPDVRDGVKASELELRWQEYYELVTMLLQWIRHHIIVFEERKFPSSYEEIEVLWRQFLKFKETELPAKETDKNRSKLIYKSLEGAVQAGQIKVPPSYHPFDVEKEWGRLHVAILEREKLLRSEFERLERLQRIVSKVQMESGLCEEQLNQVETLLQTDIRLLSAGKPIQHASEIETDLNKAENMIRYLFNDVQLLKDGRHLQAEQMYRRVYRLHERLVNLRSEFNLRLKSGVTVSQVPMTQVPITQISHMQTLQQTPQRVRPELDEVTLKYIQDLLSWVEENQRRIDGAEWGEDLPSVESQLGSHRGLHQSIEEFKYKIDRARADENQLTQVSKGAYQEYLGKLDLQYAKLKLIRYKSRLRSLDQLHAFVVAATKELMWLNEKEEEEVNYDWSDRNSNMTAKKDNYSGLMRDLEQREKRVNNVQMTGDKLLKEGHPARKTVEAFTAALQTQWSWILQLCCCIETHLKENTAYFQFFSDVKEAEERMKKMDGVMKKKYVCDRSITVTRLEDLLQDAVEEKEQLNEFKTHLEGLNRRAKTIIQLKPRNTAYPVKGKLPIQAVCDFKQMEITVHKGDECVLVNNSQPYNWKVRNSSGNEATVPSICFIIPPTNKEALDISSGLDASLQRLMVLWQKLHVDMKSLMSWQYLMRDILLINSWNLIMFKTLRVEEYRLTLKNLEEHYQAFLRDSQDSELFGADDRLQAENSYSKATQHYDNLLRSVEQGEQDESVCKSYITQIKDLRLRLEGCESRTVNRLRQLVDKEPLKACAQRATEQKKVQAELEGIKKDLDKMVEKSEAVLATSQQSSSAPVLRSEIDVTQKKMEHVYSLSSVYLDKLKTIDMVIRSTQGAEDILNKCENQLRDVNKIPVNEKDVEANQTQLQKLRTEAEGKQSTFDHLEEGLQRATAVNDRMSQLHSERDIELEHYRQLVGNLKDRWQAVFAQIELRQRELDLLSRQMQAYGQSYDWLIRWIADAKQRQEKLHAVPIGDSKTLQEQLNQEKKLLEEIEKNKDKVDECQKYAKAYIDAIKDYELQLVTYKALVEPIASPLKKTKMESVSDDIIQEYVTLRTRYSELMTLSSQYIKFIIETQRRLGDDEKTAERLKEEERKKLAEMQAELEKQRKLAESQEKAIVKAEQEANELKTKMKDEVSKRQDVAVDAEKQKHNIQRELQELKSISEQEIKSKTQQVEEALQSRIRIEEEIRIIRLQLETTMKQKNTAETELQQLRDKAADADKLQKAAQDEAEKLRKQVAEETQKKRKAEEELKLKSEAEKEAAKEKRKALEDLEKFKLQAEEAERHLKQAELEKQRQIQVVEEVAKKTAATQLESKQLTLTAKLEESLKHEQVMVIQLQEEAEHLKKQQAEANKAREQAEKELETWRQKANEALRLRLQAEEEASKKTAAQEDAEKQKEEAKREAKKRAKAEEAALKQKETAEKELENQRKMAEETAKQKLVAEQELIRLRADFEHAEQQRTVLDDELQRLKNDVNAAVKQKKELEEELIKVRKEMEVLLQMKSKAEKESMSTTEKSKQLLESEAAKMKELAEEATKLRSVAEEAKKHRQIAEEEAARQRAEAEKILKEKLAAINEATRLKTEAEIALKEKEAENDRLKRKAEDEAYQRKIFEDQASQHKQEIEEKIDQLKKSSDTELDRQKKIVEETLKQRKVVEEEIHVLKLNFEKASTGKQDLELELNKLKGIADETQKSKAKAEEEAEKFRKLALEEEKKRKQAEAKVKEIQAAEEEAARQHKAAQDEVERLIKLAEDAKKQRELAEKEAEKQVILVKEAAQKCSAAEQKAQDVLLQQNKDTMAQDKLKGEFEKARKLAQDAEKAKDKAEKEAALLQKKAEEAERQKQAAEAEAAKQAKAQEDAEKMRKEAEAEASRRAEAEAAALKQKQEADAEMAKYKKLAEKTLKQKSSVEEELVKVKVQLDETDKQKSILDDELKRLKQEVSDAIKQKAQVEDELSKVKIQMEDLLKLKLKIEKENQELMKKDKDNTKKLLEEEAENMKKLAEEAARLNIEAQEAARLRQIAESDLAKQRELADKMLEEKKQAIQEAKKLKAEAEKLQKQKDQAQVEAQKLMEAKKEIQERLEQETEGFQKSLEAERKRQLEITADAEKLKIKVAQLSDAQSKAEEEAKKFKKQADEIKSRLLETEKQTSEKHTVVEKLEIQRLQSKKEADDLHKAIAELEKEKEKLKKEAADLQKQSKEMVNVQQEQLQQEKTILQQTFLAEKETLLKKEKAVEAEKKKLEKQFEDEVKKAEALKDEQERQKEQMEEEKKKLQSAMDAAIKKQKDAEEEMHSKQKEMQELEKKRIEQEKLLAEENKNLREKLQQLQSSQKPSHTKEIEIQTDNVPEEELVQMTMVETTKKVLNGSTEVDGVKKDVPLAFDGIRDKVPASRLHEIGVLSKKEFDKLKKGKTTVQELSKSDKVKVCLKGKDCIGGVIVEPNQKMSIYQALKDKKIPQSTAMMLLEAQAASGYIIDPIKNRRLSVSEAVKDTLIGPELHTKLLSAERAATGFKDPFTGDTISLFEAMKKGLIAEDQASKLLDSQYATGGIIDPVNSHRVPVQMACTQGQLDEDLSKVLSGAPADKKAFTDPNTQDSLTYGELLERCKPDPETGIPLLPITEQAAQIERTYTDEETKEVFSKANLTVPFGRFKGKTVTIWEVINSEYFTEDQRKDLIRQYKTGKITVEKIIRIVITVVEDKENKKEPVFDGLRSSVPASELLEAKVINKDLFNKLHNGKATIKEVSELEPVKKALKGTHSIAGVQIESTSEKMSFYEAMKKDLLGTEPALNLLEAQAGTGFIIDPVKNQKFTVDEAVKSGVVGPELHEKLLSAERAVCGYKDPYTGKTVSLFEAMQKDLIKKDQGVRLLEAQLATGGIIDPEKSYRITPEIAYKRGYLNEEMNQNLSSPSDTNTVFVDPNTQEHVTYAEMLKRCITDKQTGLPLLPLSEKAIKSKEMEPVSDAQTKETLSHATVELHSGLFKGRIITIWEIINSEYFTEEQRIEFIRQYRTGKITIEKLIKIVITTVDEKEKKRQDNFEGFRGPVSASSLFESNIIDKDTYDKIQQGKKKPAEVTDSIKRYLQDSDCIAGVFLEKNKEKLSIYQAVKQKLLTPNTGLSLLEAQAATGYIVDPNRNEKFTVDDAVKAGIVGPELHEKLLSAEKAVTGYKDPYTGNKISLLQAMQKQLALREHAIPLLEAQEATGGIIDPVNSHRLPSDIAIQRGYFNKQLAKSFKDPTDDIKGFTDPNKDENVTYKQLKERCMTDPEFGIVLLPLSKAQTPEKAEKSYVYTEEQAQMDLANTQIDIPHETATGFITDPVKDELLTVDEAVRKGLVGPEIHDKLLSAERAVTGYKDPYSGKVISLFQAMKKDLVPEDYAMKLLEAQLATGGLMDPEYYFRLPIDVAMQRGYINKETSDRISDPSGDVKQFMDPTTDEKLSYALLLKRCKVDKDSGLRLLSLADKRLLFKGLRKQITPDELLCCQIIDQKTYTALMEGTISVEDLSKDLKKYLEGISSIAGVYVEATKDRLSVYQAMKKNMIRPGTAFELLEAQAATGYVIDPIKNLKMNVNEAVKTGVVGPEFKDKLLSAERAVTGYKDPYSGKVISLFQAMKKGLILKDHGIRLLEAQIATGGIIDPEESHRLPVEMAYKRGLFDEEMNGILTDPSDDTKGFFDPNTEENLTYLQLMERCMTDPETGLSLLLLKEKKRERKTSSKSSVRKRRVVIVDPETGKEMSVYEAYRKGLIDHQTYIELAEQECEWEEITTSSSDGVVKSMIIDRRSGRQYDIDDAISKGLIDQSSLDQYRAGTLSITEFADMLSGNMSGFRSRSSSFGSSSSYPMSPIPSIKTPATTWTDPSEETGPVAGILDTDTLEKVSVTEAMHRNLVDNITGQRLLEAQACTGGIIDPNTGEKFSVADAMNKGLVDKIMVDRINLAQKAFQGFEDPRTKSKMSAAQALKKGWLYYEAGQRFLEVQYLTGGLIEPDVSGRVSLDDAVKKGTLDARTAQKLRDVSGYSKYLTCPKTKLKISYKDAMDRSMIEEGSGLRLLEASSQSSKGLYSPYSISGSGSTSGSRSGSRTGSRSGSRRGSFDATGSGFSMGFSSTYSPTSYGRRYDSGAHGGLQMDELKQALLALASGRNCCYNEKRIFTSSQTQPSLVA
uniref:Plectin n=1 Tax=Cyprinus carpio TaxID=7962 RepID=A0A8C2D775_CYPCA